MELQYEGAVAWIYEDHFDVDRIIGVRNHRESNPERLKMLFMSDFEPDMPSKVKPGDILVAGRNYGYGHAHPSSMRSVRLQGINVVLAESFAAGYYRSNISAGMVLLEVPEITKFVTRGDRVHVDFANAVVKNLTKGNSLNGIKPGPVVLDLVASGGCTGFIRNELKKLPPV